MLQITVDMFSGRENPVRIITDEAEVRATLRELARERTLFSESAPSQGPLGFRGFVIEPLSDELARDFDLGASFYLPAGVQARGARSAELADRLLDLVERGETPPTYGPEETLSLDVPIRELLATQLERPSAVTVTEEVETLPTGADAATTEASEAEGPVAAAACMYEISAYNPGFWNNNATIRSRNNCYNYASNRRTDTFAQPGRGCGQMYRAINCAEVTRAALCDRLHRRYDCFPDSERPRYLVCLWMAPGYDYHWGRLMREGFWGHKPGGTAVRNTDSSGRVITNPQTANMAPYTQFCGYFYTCRSQLIR